MSCKFREKIAQVIDNEMIELPNYMKICISVASRLITLDNKDGSTLIE